MNPTPPRLSADHYAMLEASSIDPDVISERGYGSVGPSRLAELGFSVKQQRAGLLVPLWWAGEVVSHQVRADRPRASKDGDPIKYETTKGAVARLDCHPRAQPLLADPSVPLWVTEGAKKADALVSRGVVAVNVAGVFSFAGHALPDWDDVALEGRTVYVAYDSDVSSKPEVRKALRRISDFLRRRGARVLVVNLPGGPGGTKVGADDYLAEGGDLDELEREAKPYDLDDDPDVQRELDLLRVKTRARELYEAERSPSRGAQGQAVLRTLTDLALLPKVGWTVQGVVQEGEGTLVYGPRGSGKSLVALDLACHVVAGLPWRERAVRQGPVVMVALENAFALYDRVTAWKDQHPGADTSRLYFVVEPLRAREDRDVEALVGAVEQLGQQPAMVVVDTQQRFAAGLDENAGQDMQYLVDVVDGLRRRLGCSVLMVHHAGKDPSRGARGYSLIEASYTAVIAVTQQKRLEGTHDVREVTASAKKVNNAPDAWSETWRLEHEGSYAWLEPEDSFADLADGVIAAVRAFITDNPESSQRAVERGVGGTAEHVRAALAHLVDLGEVVNVGTVNRHKYRLSASESADAVGVERGAQKDPDTPVRSASAHRSDAPTHSAGRSSASASESRRRTPTHPTHSSGNGQIHGEAEAVTRAEDLVVERLGATPIPEGEGSSTHPGTPLAPACRMCGKQGVRTRDDGLCAVCRAYSTHQGGITP